MTRPSAREAVSDALVLAERGLLETRRKPASGDWISLSGADPLNLAGILTPGAKLVALTGNRPAILPSDLPGEISNGDSLNFVPLIEIPEGGINFQNVVTDMERELILQSLRRTNGNKKKDIAPTQAEHPQLTECTGSGLKKLRNVRGAVGA